MSPSLTRRALLAGLAGTAGCLRLKPAVAPLVEPDAALRLGWRWIPGVSMGWRTVITREVGPVAFTRAEDWRYTAVDLDPSGVIHLEGALAGFGATVVADGHPLPDDRLAAAREAARAAVPEAVQVGLRLSGRLVRLSEEAFEAALPHRLLALHFPPEPVLPGESWPDEGLVRAFAPALPLDTDLQAEATTRLAAVDTAGAGWRATLDHVARLEVDGGAGALEITGTSTWDTDPGALHTRAVEARWWPDQRADGLPIGRLRVEVRPLEADA